MLDGITFAGFNVVDTLRLFEMTNLPVIAVTRERPSFDDIRRAVENLPFGQERWETIKNSDRIVKVFTRGEEAIFIQATGVKVDVAKRIVKNTATRSNVPEALRVAHLVASGLDFREC